MLLPENKCALAENIVMIRPKNFSRRVEISLGVFPFISLILETLPIHFQQLENIEGIFVYTDDKIPK